MHVPPSQVVVPGAWQPPAGGAALTWLVGAAALVMLALLAVATVRTREVFDGHGAAAVAMVAAVVLVGALATWAVNRYDDVPPAARALVVLAAVQAALAVAVAVVWAVLTSEHAALAVMVPLAGEVATPALAAGAAVLAAALVVGRGSTATPRWLTAVAALAIAYVVAAAVWLAVGSSVGALAASSAAGLRAALVPPLVVAAIVAYLVTWRPQWLRAARWPLTLGGVWLVMVAVAAIDLGPDRDDGARVYAQFVPVLVGAGWFATMTVVALALAHGRGLRRAARAQRSAAIQRGTVVVAAPASTTVASLHHRGWLAGLAPQCQGFTLRTARGDLAVPPGVDVVGPTPPWVVQAGTGARVPVLGDGDEVEVAGFQTATTGDGAFRTTTRPVLGTRGAMVFTARRTDEPIGRDLLLRIWQPCAVLLAASVVAALPGLAGLL